MTRREQIFWAIQIFHGLVIAVWMGALIAGVAGKSPKWIHRYRMINTTIITTQCIFGGCPLTALAASFSDGPVPSGSFVCWAIQHLFHIRIPSWTITGMLIAGLGVGYLIAQKRENGRAERREVT